MPDATLHYHLEPSSGVPIYRQLMDQVLALVTSGVLPAGEMLPSVRQMAAALDVNMMTVSKAYARLEADGVLERVRGTGMRVVEIAAGGTLAERKSQLGPAAESLVVRGRQLGLTDPQILSVVQTHMREKR